MIQRKKQQANFQSTLEALEKIVSRLEGQQQPLETALKDFEEGIHHVRQCQALLDAAQQKVQILIEPSSVD